MIFWHREIEEEKEKEQEGQEGKKKSKRDKNARRSDTPLGELAVDSGFSPMGGARVSLLTEKRTLTEKW